MGWAEKGGVPILLFLPPPFPSLFDHLTKKKKSTMYYFPAEDI